MFQIQVIQYHGAYLCLDETWFAGAEEAVKTLVSDNCGKEQETFIVNFQSVNNNTRQEADMHFNNMNLGQVLRLTLSKSYAGLKHTMFSYILVPVL